MFSQAPAERRSDKPTPLFVGREEQLALAIRRWDSAHAGKGHFLLVAGEAGIGKTRLLGEIAKTIPAAKQLSASVFPRDIEAVGGLVLDLALALGRTSDVSAADSLRLRLTA